MAWLMRYFPDILSTLGHDYPRVLFNAFQNVLSMLFTTFIVRSPIFPVGPWQPLFNKPYSVPLDVALPLLAKKWRPMPVEPPLEMFCLKHYLCVNVCQHGVYLENEMAIIKTYIYHFHNKDN